MAMLIATSVVLGFQIAPTPMGAVRSGAATPLVRSSYAVPSSYAPQMQLFGQKEKKEETAKKEGEEEMSESKALMQKVKDAGTAGIISYVFWEWAFWGVSVPVALFGFKSVVGYWPDFSNSDDMAKL